MKMEYCETCIFFKECEKKDYVCPAGKRMLILLQETRKEISITLRKLIERGEIIEIDDKGIKRYVMAEDEKEKSNDDIMFI